MSAWYLSKLKLNAPISFPFIIFITIHQHASWMPQRIWHYAKWKDSLVTCSCQQMQIIWNAHDCWKGCQKLKLQNEISSQCIDGLVQERRNSSALAMELLHSCTNPFIHAEQISKESAKPSKMIPTRKSYYKLGQYFTSKRARFH